MTAILLSVIALGGTAVSAYFNWKIEKEKRLAEEERRKKEEILRKSKIENVPGYAKAILDAENEAQKWE